MSFNTDKNLRSSRKIVLIRIKPRRYVNDLLTSIGSGRYTLSFEYDIESILQDNVALTLVTGTPSSGQYSYANNLLTIYPPDGITEDYPIIINYYIFLSNHINPYTYQTPTDDTSPIRFWHNRIQKELSSSQSIKEIQSGVLEISDSSIEIINVDNWFYQFLTSNDSFNNAEVEQWFAINDLSDPITSYKGFVSGLSLDDESVFITVYDSLKRLTEKALFSIPLSSISLNLDDYPNCNPASIGEVIPIFFGLSTKYALMQGTSNFVPTGDYTFMNEAYCIDYPTTPSASSQMLSWIAGRSFSYSAATLTCAATYVSCLPLLNGGRPTIQLTTSANATRLINMIQLGDSLQVNTPTGGLYIRVLSISVSTLRITGHNFDEHTTSGLTCGGFNTLTSVTYSEVIPNVVIVENATGKEICPKFGRDYTVTTTTAYTGLAIDTHVINFTSNFHNNLDDMSSVLHADFYKVYYRAIIPSYLMDTLDIFLGAFTFLKIPYNAASFTALNSYFESNNIYPVFSSGNDINIESYAHFLQLLLKSLNCYLFLNNDFEIEIARHSTPSGSITIDDDNIKKSSYKLIIDYKDLKGEVSAFNPECSSTIFPDSVVNLISNKSKQLHDAKEALVFEHVLNDITLPLQDIFNTLKSGNETYSITVKNKAVDASLGDDFIINKNGIVKSVRLLAIDKTLKEQRIELSDMGDL